MTTYEFLATHELAFTQVEEHSVKTSDVKYLELYREYVKLIKEGHKKTYIVQYLSDQYEIYERTIYRIIDRMNQKVEL